MKINLLFILLSIFSVNTICKAQSKSVISSKEKHQLSICNYKYSVLKINDLLKLSEEGCDRVVYMDANGNELKLDKFLIAHIPKGGLNSSFEEITGDRLSENFKARLSKIKAGDKIMISHVSSVDKSQNAPAYKGNVTRFYKIVE